MESDAAIERFSGESCSNFGVRWWGDSALFLRSLFIFLRLLARSFLMYLCVCVYDHRKTKNQPLGLKALKKNSVPVLTHTHTRRDQQQAGRRVSPARRKQMKQVKQVGAIAEPTAEHHNAHHTGQQLSHSPRTQI